MQLVLSQEINSHKDYYMASYKRPPRPDDRFALPPSMDPEMSDEELRNRLKNFPEGPLLPVVDDLNQAKIDAVPPADEPAEDLIAEDNTPLPDEEPSDSDIAKRLREIGQKMSTTKYPAQIKRGEGADLTPDIEDLKSRLAALDNEQDSAQKNIEQRQLMAELATQVGKFAAAQYGAKHNIDMAGLKPDAPKFDNEYARLIDKYKNAKADERDVAELNMKDKLRRAERIDQDAVDTNRYNQSKYAAEEEARLRGLSEEAKGLLTAENLRAKRDIAKAKAAEKEQSTLDKAALKREEAYAKLANNVNNAFQGKGSREVKAAKAMAILRTNPLTKGIPQKEWENLLTEEGTLWGTNARDPEDAIANITNKLSELALANQPLANKAAAASGQSTPPAPMVTVIHKASGISRQYPANDPAVAKARNDPNFEVR